MSRLRTNVFLCKHDMICVDKNRQTWTKHVGKYVVPAQFCIIAALCKKTHTTYYIRYNRLSFVAKI